MSAPRCLAVAALCTAILTAGPARAQLSPDDVVLEDAIAVQVIDRDVVAFDLQGTGQLVTRLELDERVLWSSSRGRVAVVLTDRRALAATPRSGSWQAARYRLSETPQERAWISQRLALVVTGQRALGFFGDVGNWAKQSLGPDERVVDARIGPGTAVVVTDRRALGLSSATGGFFETRLRVHEEIESVSAIQSIATVTTSQRTLVFKGPSALWVERGRRLQ